MTFCFADKLPLFSLVGTTVSSLLIYCHRNAQISTVLSTDRQFSQCKSVATYLYPKKYFLPIQEITHAPFQCKNAKRRNSMAQQFRCMQKT